MLVLIAVFGIIFFINQKDSLINGLAMAEPTPVLDDDTGRLSLITPIRLNNQKDLKDVQGVQAIPSIPDIENMPTLSVVNEINASYSAVIKTSKGVITLTLFGKDAPKTVANFINKAKSGFYDNMTFHRVEDWVIQGGDPDGDGTGGGQMETELNSLPFQTGSLGVARGGDIKVSNDAQFFITKSEASWLNGQYANFGMVENGMDVVNQIEIGDKILEIEIK